MHPKVYNTIEDYLDTSPPQPNRKTRKSSTTFLKSEKIDRNTDHSTELNVASSLLQKKFQALQGTPLGSQMSDWKFLNFLKTKVFF